MFERTLKASEVHAIDAELSIASIRGKLGIVDRVFDESHADDDPDLCQCMIGLCAAMERDAGNLRKWFEGLPAMAGGEALEAGSHPAPVAN